MTVKELIELLQSHDNENDELFIEEYRYYLRGIIARIDGFVICIPEKDEE